MRIKQHLVRVVLVFMLLFFVKTIAWAQPAKLAHTSHVMAAQPLGASMAGLRAVEVITSTSEPTPPVITKTPTIIPTVVASETPTMPSQPTESATVMSTATTKAPSHGSTKTPTDTPPTLVATETPSAQGMATIKAPILTATDTSVETATPQTLPMTGASSSGNLLIWMVCVLAFCLVVGSEYMLRWMFRRS